MAIHDGHSKLQSLHSATKPMKRQSYKGHGELQGQWQGMSPVEPLKFWSRRGALFPSATCKCITLIRFNLYHEVK